MHNFDDLLAGCNQLDKVISYLPRQIDKIADSYLGICKFILIYFRIYLNKLLVTNGKNKTPYY